MPVAIPVVVLPYAYMLVATAAVVFAVVFVVVVTIGAGVRR